LLSIDADEPDFGHSDAIVDPSLIPFRRAPVEPPWNRH
jgi:hypothetical protein